MEPELFDRMMSINVRAPFFLMQEAIKLMTREGVAGSIVNISSVASHGSVPFLAPYAASKGALNILTKNIAYSVVRHRIRVNALNLGWMDTSGEDVIQRRYHSDGKDWLADAEAQQPFGRLLKTEEVARTIAYLASDESGMMTGALIDFDQSIIGAGAPPHTAADRGMGRGREHFVCVIGERPCSSTLSCIREAASRACKVSSEIGAPSTVSRPHMGHPG